ncbi:MAG TPA: sulfotransferase [Burkholderiales bacterium]|nr:sulfotransferase [Burkholderiales bacterium]
MSAAIEARRRRGHALAVAGRWREAAKEFAAVAAARPSHAPAFNNLGVCHMELGDPGAAAECFATALRFDKDYAQAADNLGLALKQQGRLAEALACHERALELRPGWLDAQVHRAGVLQALGRIDAAREGFASALAREPGHPGARTGLAELHAWRGEREAGLAVLEPLLASGRPGLAAATVHARLQAATPGEQRAIELLEAALEEPANPHERRQAHFALGALYDAAGDHRRAFDQVRRANGLRRAAFDPAAHSRFVDALIETFSVERYACLPRARDTGELPVFIVGMPRSGTSLVEQILAAHPRVHGAGELAAIAEIAQRSGAHAGGYPAGIASATVASLEAAAHGYAETLARDAGGALRATDKMPLNFLHLGLIGLLFPRARVVHVRREPMDTGLSCYFQDFLDPALAFSFDLGHTGHYLADYLRLMEHWRRLAPLAMLEIDYERLVAEPGAVSREMVAFLDLEWDAACLDFHRSGRYVNTASHAQVRRPVYADSVARYRRYAVDLQPMREAMNEGR